MTAVAGDVSHDVVVVAGGSGSRLGGAVKADLVLGGQRLIDRILAATGQARARVLVGRGIAVPDDVVVTLEHPPSGGPAAGTAAGLRAVARPSPWTLLLAGDLADPASGIAALLTAAAEVDAAADASDVDGLCLAGDAEHPQWLFGLHRTRALRAAVDSLDQVHDRSMKALLSPLRLRTVPVAADTVADIDTTADLDRWSARLGTTAPRVPRMRGDTAQQARWRAWVELAADAVGVDPDLVDITGIHALTKQVAHGYDRPLAPVGAYLLGLAVGAAQERGEPVDQAALRRAIQATLADAPPIDPEEES